MYAQLSGGGPRPLITIGAYAVVALAWWVTRRIRHRRDRDRPRTGASTPERQPGTPGLQPCRHCIGAAGACPLASQLPAGQPAGRTSRWARQIPRPHR